VIGSGAAGSTGARVESGQRVEGGFVPRFRRPRRARRRFRVTGAPGVPEALPAVRLEADLPELSAIAVQSVDHPVQDLDVMQHAVVARLRTKVFAPALSVRAVLALLVVDMRMSNLRHRCAMDFERAP
jgi:hypothetical protein